MQKLQGKIITGLQHCEDQDVIYRAYVMRDVNDEEIEILDQEHLQEWLRNGGNLEMFTIEREEVISVNDIFYSDLLETMKQLGKELR